MSTIYELSQLQAELKDALFWEDPDSEEAVNIANLINKVEGNVYAKLQWLTTVLAESVAFEEAIELENKAIAERRQKHLKRAKNATQRTKEFMIKAMEHFDIKKVEGEYISYTLMPPKKSLVYTDNFDPLLLPKDCLKCVETIKPIAVMINKHLDEGEILQGVYQVEKLSLRSS